MTEKTEGLDLDVEVPTAAYEVWTKEENEEDKMEIFRNLPEVATVHNKLYRDQDVEEALREAVQHGAERERRRILNKIEELRMIRKIESFGTPFSDSEKAYKQALKDLKEEIEEEVSESV
jgi:hypothetical protein